jgi:hypothetical protein
MKPPFIMHSKCLGPDGPIDEIAGVGCDGKM